MPDNSQRSSGNVGLIRAVSAAFDQAATGDGRCSTGAWQSWARLHASVRCRAAGANPYFPFYPAYDLPSREGIPSPRKRRAPKHCSRRESKPQAGMLLQADGIRHDWLEGRGPCLSLVGLHRRCYLGSDLGWFPGGRRCSRVFPWGYRLFA